MSSQVRDSRASISWGDWRLDDLTETLISTRPMLPPSVAVFWIALRSPSAESELPTIQIAVPTRDDVELVQDRLEDYTDVLEMQPDLIDGGFRASTSDVNIQVWCGREGMR